MRLKLLLFIIILLSLFGCSKQENLVSKQFLSDNDWTVTVSLLWDYDQVVGQVNAKYNGQKPLDYVIIEPHFDVSGWPEGYIPPTSGKYTWKPENPEGAIPDVQDTSTRSNAILSKSPTRIMSKSEAEKILDQVSADIEWKETKGQTLRTRIE